MGTFFGKYKATVTKVFDENKENRGRIKVQCPAVLGEYESNWCEPCFNFCYDNGGDFFLPKKGDTVWVEFEEGDANKPIWAGNWFSKDSTPIAKIRNEVNNPSAPALKDYEDNHDKVRVISFEDKFIVLHKDYMRIYIDDGTDTEIFFNKEEFYIQRQKGKMEFRSIDDKTELKRNDSEVVMIDSDTTIKKAGSSIKLTPDGIEINAKTLNISIAEGTTITDGKSMTISSPATSVS